MKIKKYLILIDYPHRINLSDKINLKKSDKYFALLNLSIYYIWKNIKFKISAPTWNEDFKLYYRSYFISDIQDYFEQFLEKHGEEIYNPSTKICGNKTVNRTTIKTKTRHCLELLRPETIKSLGSTESTKNKDKTMKICLIQKSLK